MYLKKIVILTLTLVLNSYLHAQDKDLQHTSEIANAFDFWVGNWEVSWYGKDSTKTVGTNKISKILDGKVIQENFEDPSMGVKGTSISVFNPRSNVWYQAWADTQGSFYNFVGEVYKDKRIFKTPQKDKNGILWRIVFTDILENSLTWKFQGTKNDGETWDTFWTIYYNRIE